MPHMWMLLFLAALCAGAHAQCPGRSLLASSEPLGTEELCKKYDMIPREKPAVVYDAFLFNDELDMLEIRLNEVYDVVDHIVIVESAVTHQERPKPLHYKENAARYARFADKIIPVALEGLLKTKPDWFTKLQSSFYMEWAQRELMFSKGLFHPGKEVQAGDLIMSGDLDEIPKAEAVRAVKHCGWAVDPGKDDCVALEGSFSYYSYSRYMGEWNAGPRVVRWLENGTTSDGQEFGKNDMRYKAKCTRILQHSSWHCTDCFATIAQLKRKISSFCHSDLDRFPYNTSEFIVDRVARGLALFTNNATEAQMTRRPYCDNAPPFVLAHPGRFHYMLSRDPVTASFSDYAEYLGDRTDVVGNFHGAWYGNDEKWHEE